LKDKKGNKIQSQMTFHPLPIIQIMLNLYEKPRTVERFQEYLKLLQGDTKGDLVMPIGGFNPMAKESLILKLKELQALKAEQIMAEILSKINLQYSTKNNDKIFKVALNLSDDLQGGWTNRFTSDYDSKFKINALINRQFCTPIFWSSEEFTEEKIRQRVAEYVFRTIYWLEYPKPKTLKDHVTQEQFVRSQTGTGDNILTNEFYQKHQNSEDYHLIFNFFYGDEASEFLGFSTFEIGKHAYFML
jgi:hypothetical protein